MAKARNVLAGRGRLAWGCAGQDERAATPIKKGASRPLLITWNRLLFGFWLEHLVQLLDARQDLELVERVTDTDLLENPGAGQD